MLDKFKDECGVFGIFGHPEASNMTYLGLYALQHRGQESAGIDLVGDLPVDLGRDRDVRIALDIEVVGASRIRSGGCARWVLECDVWMT